MNRKEENKSAQQTLELHFGSDLFLLKEQGHISFILAAMEEYAEWVAKKALEDAANEVSKIWTYSGAVQQCILSTKIL